MVKTSFTLELPEDDMKKLRIIAGLEDSSVARLVRQSVKEYLERYMANEDARMSRSLSAEERKTADEAWTKIFETPPPIDPKDQK